MNDEIRTKIINAVADEFQCHTLTKGLTPEVYQFKYGTDVGSVVEFIIKAYYDAHN